MNARQSSLCALLALLSGWSSGCIHITDEIDLTYDPRGGRERIAGAEGIAVQVQLVDNRPVKTDVGKIINGNGGEVGEIIPIQEVTEYVADIIRSELAARGFASGDKVLVSGDLKSYYNRFKLGLWTGDSIADFVLGIDVKHPDGTSLYAKTITAEGIEPNIQEARGHNAKVALEKAAARGVGDLFQDAAFLAALYNAAGMTPP